MVSKDESRGRQYRVAAGQAGMRIDRFLQEMVPGLSRRGIASWIEEQGILCNGRPVRKGSIVREGDRVALPSPLAPLREGIFPDSNLPLNILWEDSFLVAVDKPRGMPTHPLRSGEGGTVANGLVARYPEMKAIGFSPREPGLLHRLDRDTSGVLLAARKSSAFERLCVEFEQGRVVKIYSAVVHGRPVPKGAVTLPLASGTRRARRMEVVRDPLRARGLRRCRPAETQFRVIRYYGHFALVRLRMTTGVRHQLRAHMAYLGHPVVGDSVYSDRQASASARQPMRHLLHASEIRFYHPSDGRPVRIGSRLPADIRSFLRSLAQG